MLLDVRGEEPNQTEEKNNNYFRKNNFSRPISAKSSFLMCVYVYEMKISPPTIVFQLLL